MNAQSRREKRSATNSLGGGKLGLAKAKQEDKYLYYQRNLVLLVTVTARHRASLVVHAHPASSSWCDKGDRKRPQGIKSVSKVGQ